MHVVPCPRVSTSCSRALGMTQSFNCLICVEATRVRGSCGGLSSDRVFIGCAVVVARSLSVTKQHYLIIIGK